MTSRSEYSDKEKRWMRFAQWLNRRTEMAEVDKSPFKQSDVTKDTKEVLGEQQTKTSSDPKGDVTAERTEKQVVRGTIKPDKEG